MDLTQSIVPRSDQLNAEDFLAGPQTVTIAEVRAGSAEQPFDFHLVETPGRPYRPSKTMRRVIVKAWGPETDVFPGRRLTLYRDPDVKFGGQKVGGIKISHLSHIDRAFTLALTETRGKRAMHTVEPLPERAASASPRDTPAPDRITVLMSSLGITARDHALRYVADVIGREVASRNELTDAETRDVIDALERDTKAGA